MSRLTRDRPATSASSVIPVGEQGSPRDPDRFVHRLEDGAVSRWESNRARWSSTLERGVAWADGAMAWFWNNPYAFALLVLVAVVSAAWGYVSFYGPQYSRVPWYLWVFVPDSPFALTLWIAAAFAVRAGLDRRPGGLGVFVAFLAAWAAASNVKVGLWTPFILTFYPDVFFTGSSGKQAFQVLLLLAHVGMVAFGLLLLRKMRALAAVAYVGVLGLLFLWDFMDYFFVEIFLPGSGIQVYPLGIPPGGPRLSVTIVTTLAMSVASGLGVWLGVRLRGPPSRR